MVQEVFKAGPPAWTRVYFPEKSGQVPDRPALTLVVMAPDQAHGDPGHPQAARPDRPRVRAVGADVQECPALRGPRGRRRAPRRGPEAARLGGHRRRTTRPSSGSTKASGGNSTPAPRRPPATSRRRSGGPTSTSSCWVKDNTLQEIDLGLVNSSAAGSLAELIRQPAPRAGRDHRGRRPDQADQGLAARDTRSGRPRRCGTPSSPRPPCPGC